MALSYTSVAQQTKVAYQQLSWEHFKGAVPSGDTVLARIFTSIQYHVKKVNIFTGKLTFIASASMDPDNSWVKEDSKTDLALQHEQTHFDIANYCAGLLERELNQLKPAMQKQPVVEKIFQKWFGNMALLNESFDRDFQRSYNVETINTWRMRLSEKPLL